MAGVTSDRGFWVIPPLSVGKRGSLEYHSLTAACRSVAPEVGVGGEVGVVARGSRPARRSSPLSAPRPSPLHFL